MKALFHVVVAVACCIASVPSIAQKAGKAADFPSRPIRVIVPFSPGGQPDIFARLIGQKVSEAFGQQMIVDNRVGAGGLVGSKIVVEAAPDGYTLLATSSSFTILPTVRKVPFDVSKDFAGISQIYAAAYLLVVPTSSPAKTVKDLVALAKSKPGQLNLASAGLGSGTHFAGEYLQHTAGIDVTHVPYKGIPEATNDLIAGRVQMFMAPLASAAPLVRDNRMRALGITSLKRAAVFPDIPTLDESGLKGFRWDSWGGMYAPAKTPRAVIERLNREVTAALRQPDVAKTMRSLGAEPAPTTPAELDKFVADDLIKVQKIAKLAGLKPE
jgi:tripartite-type tricarboxylate transporter receptor subunit TctC